MIVEAALATRLARIRLLVCDVDGTLTDGAMWYGPEGEALKRFHTRDGHGIGQLLAAGVAVALVTSEDTPIVTARARKLGIDDVVLGCRDKRAAVLALRTSRGLERDEVAMIGDDLGDLPGYDEVGVAVAVADAEPSVLTRADLRCERNGGFGAVRELADAILDAVRTGSGESARLVGEVRGDGE